MTTLYRTTGFFPYRRGSLCRRITSADRYYLNTRKFLVFLICSVGVTFYSSIVCMAGELDDLLGNDDSSVEELLLDKRAKAQNLGGLRYSCLLDPRIWQHVKPMHPRKNSGKTQPVGFGWQESKMGVSPMNSEPITVLINVPKSGKYRVFVRYALTNSRMHAFRLGLKCCENTGISRDSRTPQEQSSLSHDFGRQSLLGRSGRELEKALPIVLERESDRVGFLSGNVSLWEYWDVDLKKGTHELALSSRDRDTCISGLLITQGKAFRPSVAPSKNDRTLGRLYMRVRLEDPPKRQDRYSLSAGLLYHWRGRNGKKGPMWGYPVGSADKIPADSWSPFLELTDAAIPGPGAWSTCNLSFRDASAKKASIQFAWYPDEAAVLKEIKVGIGDDHACFRVPHGDPGFRNCTATPMWGIWRQDYLDGFKNMRTVLDQYLAWTREEAQALGLPKDWPRCRNIRIMTGNGTTPSYNQEAAEMLATLGVNRIKGRNAGLHGFWSSGAPASIVEKYDLYDETTSTFTTDAEGIASKMTPDQRARHTLHKGGDEISTYVQPKVINGDPEKLNAFHAYLAEQAKLRGMSVKTFLGVDNLSSVRCLGTPSENGDLFQRRLYYHSHRFCHLASVPGYRQIVEKFQKYFPNILVYNNYTPHPVFLTGTTMNNADWFVLCRNKAQTLAWAEDWVRRSHSKFGFQDVSFYAALVACAARKYGYPSGFYVGLNCGGGARKLFSCVGQGLTWLTLYAWGPVDSIAEGSNAWSWYRSQYRATLLATHALGPADTIITEGKREPARVAILYNRSHEIWQGGTGRLNKDWLWSFTALRCDQIPVDVIIEEDLIPAELERYDVLFLGGFNLEPSHLKNIHEWLAKDEKHLVIGSGGALMYDIYNTPMPAAEQLFGAKQVMASKQHARSLKTARFISSDLYSATEVPAEGRDDLKFILTPTSGKPIAYYDGGDCAAVENRVGKGRVLLLGFYPGYTFYYDDGRINAPVRKWHNEPVLRTLGRQRVEFDYHLSEVTLFEHPDGAAVLLTDFGKASTDVTERKDAPPAKEDRRLSVRCNHPVKSVTSALRGSLKWRKKDGRIEIQVPNPDPVDVVLLKW